MDKKYIFFDVDGTLMNLQGAVEDSTRDSLLKLKEQGHEIFLATGRCPYDIPDFIERFEFNGMVLSDGAYVEYNKEVLLQESMDASQLDALTASIEADGGHLMYFGKDASFISEKSLGAYEVWVKVLLVDDSFWGELKGKIRIVESLTQVSDQNIGKMIYIDYEGDLEQLKKEFGHYFSILPNNLASLSDMSKGEITRLDINKAYGIKKILNHVGATKEDVIAFGDGLNDMEMLQLAKVGVAMGNGAPKLKEIADVVTTPIGEDGIYKGLKELGLV